MENYKQKYEQAMFRMNKWVEGSEIIDPKEVAEFVFPELKESEDERIKEAITKTLKRIPSREIECFGVTKDSVYAWLEKQNPAWSEEDEGMCIFTIKILNDIHYKDNANWLKSIKDRMKGE